MNINPFGVFTLIIFLLILLFSYSKTVWRDPSWSAWYFEVVVFLILLGLIVGIVF